MLQDAKEGEPHQSATSIGDTEKERGPYPPRRSMQQREKRATLRRGAEGRSTPLYEVAVSRLGIHQLLDEAGRTWLCCQVRKNDLTPIH